MVLACLLGSLCFRSGERAGAEGAAFVVRLVLRNLIKLAGTARNPPQVTLLAPGTMARAGTRALRRLEGGPPCVLAEGPVPPVESQLVAVTAVETAVGAPQHL